MKIMSTIGFTLFISIFFVVGFGILGYGIYSLHASKQAKNWPTAEGKITTCELKESSDSDGTTYRAVVRYSYAVAGRSYEGNRVAFGYSGSSSRTAHQEIVDRLSSAKTVRVRYDPADVTRSVLSYGLNRSTIFLLVFGATWLLSVTGFTVLWSVESLSDTGILSTLVTTE
ncbi:MAG: DUF3592 domain-containing protein [Candidatus Competibacteraceae bacterium]